MLVEFFVQRYARKPEHIGRLLARASTVAISVRRLPSGSPHSTRSYTKDLNRYTRFRIVFNCILFLALLSRSFRKFPNTGSGAGCATPIPYLKDSPFRCLPTHEFSRGTRKNNGRS